MGIKLFKILFSLSKVFLWKKIKGLSAILLNLVRTLKMSESKKICISKYHQGFQSKSARVANVRIHYLLFCFKCHHCEIYSFLKIRDYFP